MRTVRLSIGALSTIPRVVICFTHVASDACGEGWRDMASKRHRNIIRGSSVGSKRRPVKAEVAGSSPAPGVFFDDPVVEKAFMRILENVIADAIKEHERMIADYKKHGSFMQRLMRRKP
jgi:hypothetical protein